MFPVFFSFQGALQDVLGGAAGRFRSSSVFKGRCRTFPVFFRFQGARALLRGRRRAFLGGSGVSSYSERRSSGSAAPLSAAFAATPAGPCSFSVLLSASLPLLNPHFRHSATSQPPFPSLCPFSTPISASLLLRSHHFSFMVKHFWPFLTDPLSRHRRKLSISLHDTTFLALSVIPPLEKNVGLRRFRPFLLYHESQPKPAIRH